MAKSTTEFYMISKGLYATIQVKSATNPYYGYIKAWDEHYIIIQTDVSKRRVVFIAISDVSSVSFDADGFSNLLEGN